MITPIFKRIPHDTTSIARIVFRSPRKNEVRLTLIKTERLCKAIWQVLTI
ncbi:hypothetical protein CKA32_002490 [Geitlerinema sp. FC II]|nr:hypothetical protein CKA32_002490 [Geitlerinema sp. FC II]